MCVCFCSKDLAKALGYSNYAEMSLSSKMAGTVENVLSMIDRLYEFINDSVAWSSSVVSVSSFACAVDYLEDVNS